MKIERQITEAIWQYRQEHFGEWPDKICMTQTAYNELVAECSPHLIAYADKSEDTMYGIPIEVIQDSPCGYVCAGSKLHRVVRDDGT